MTNEEQLAILRQGVEVWNRWREEYPDIPPDFVGADLTKITISYALLDGADLLEANLEWATIQEARLRYANLRRASLRGVQLQEANLRGASLQEADLKHADLEHADLRRADLRRADLCNAKLHDADLQGADLQGADLYNAYLAGADLRGANLTGVNLYNADLQGADLAGADLAGADLQETNLTGVNFQEAFLFECVLKNATVGATLFADINLRGVHGLDTVEHRGPSTIGIDTLYRSQGDIPEIFLRGCGVPDSMIEYARALVAAERPIDYYSVFISYSSTDEDIAHRLHADLQARGVRCWFAPHDLAIGAPIVRGIDEAIRIYDKLLIILSETAVTSRWVDFEISTALHREVERGRAMLFPIRLDDAVLHTPSGWAAQLRTRHIGDFRNWKDHDRYQAAFTRLLRDLKAKEQAGA